MSSLTPVPFQPLPSFYSDSLLKESYSRFNSVTKSESCKGDKADVGALREEREEGRRKLSYRELESPQNNFRAIQDIQAAKYKYLDVTSRIIKDFCVALHRPYSLELRPEILTRLTDCNSKICSFLNFIDFLRYSNITRQAHANKSETLSAFLRNQTHLGYRDIIDYAKASHEFIAKDKREDRRTFDYELSDGMVEWIAQKCPNLKSIDFTPTEWASHYMPTRQHIKHRITNKGIETLFTECRSLESLSLGGCEKIDRFTAKTILAMKSRLRALNLESSGFEDHGLQELTPLPLLTDINISRIHCSEKVCSAFLAGSPQLQTVSMVSQHDFTDNLLKSIATHNRDLRSINLRLCPHFTIDGIEKIANQCPRLKKILLSTVYGMKPSISFVDYRRFNNLYNHVVIIFQG